MTVLLREAIGERLRETRTAQRRTLREVSRVARVSLGYLSEVERGRKEASSELLAAICDALELPLPELLTNVAFDMTGPEILAQPAPAGAPTEPAATLDAGQRLSTRLGDTLPDLRLQTVLSHRLSGTVDQPKNKVTVAA